MAFSARTHYRYSPLSLSPHTHNAWLVASLQLESGIPDALDLEFFLGKVTTAKNSHFIVCKLYGWSKHLIGGTRQWTSKKITTSDLLKLDSSHGTSKLLGATEHQRGYRTGSFLTSIRSMQVRSSTKARPSAQREPEKRQAACLSDSGRESWIRRMLQTLCSPLPPLLLAEVGLLSSVVGYRSIVNLLIPLLRNLHVHDPVLVL